MVTIIVSSLKRIIKEALENRVFPGGVLLASKQGEVLIREAFGSTDFDSHNPVSQDTIYDLASLTKPLATTLAVMHLVDTASLKLDQTLGELLPTCTATDKADINVEHLLAHSSGLPDYRPYWRELSGATVLQRDAELKSRLVREAPAYPTGDRTVYSDLGFMFLRWVMERVSGLKMSRLVEEIYSAMGLKGLFFPDARKPAAGRFAPTEKCSWRNRTMIGAVHDENALAVGGVDGHAGLFGTGSAVHNLLREMWCAYTAKSYQGVLPQGLVHVFLDYGKGEGRALGFDRPTRPGSSSGRYFSENSVGHLGFTGTSFWMDLDQGIIVTLLTNRIHPTRANEKIKAFRPKLHDAVMQILMRA